MRMWRHQWPGVPGHEVLSDEGEVALLDVPFWGSGGASRPFTVIAEIFLLTIMRNMTTSFAFRTLDTWSLSCQKGSQQFRAGKSLGIISNAILRL